MKLDTNSDQENNVVELLVYTVFGNEAATELTLPGLIKATILFLG